MALRASDLPDSTKKMLLAEIREAMDPAEYRRLVSSYGEDSVLDMFLRSASAISEAQSLSARSRGSAWSKAGRTLERVLGAWWPLLILLALGSGWAGFLTLVSSVVVWFLGAALFHAIGAIKRVNRAAAWIFGILVGLAAVAGIGYGLWVGVPWIIGGVRKWWEWLAGRLW